MFIVHFISIIIHQLHLRSSDIRSQRLGSSAIEDIKLRKTFFGLPHGALQVCRQFRTQMTVMEGP